MRLESTIVEQMCVRMTRIPVRDGCASIRLGPNGPISRSAWDCPAGCTRLVNPMCSWRSISWQLPPTVNQSSLTPSWLWRCNCFHEVLRHFPPGCIIVPFGPAITLKVPSSPNDNSVGVMFGHLQLESPEISRQKRSLERWIGVVVLWP